MAAAINDEVREALSLFLKKILQDVAVYAEHARRKTVTCQTCHDA